MRLAVFAYRAIDAQRRRVSGTVTAETAQSARQGLRAQGMTIARLESINAAKRSRWPIRRVDGRFARRIHPDRVAELWRNLAVLLQAGVPLTHALEVCRRQHGGRMDGTLRQILDAVRSGAPFAQVLRSHPSIADDLTCAVVQVGQDGGALSAALLHLAEYQERRRGTANKLTTALIYPAILCVVGFVIVIFLMTYVVPQLVDVLASASRELPWPTRVLQTCSQFLVSRWPWLMAALGIAAFLIAGSQRTNRGRQWRERVSLAVPVWGELVRKAWVSRISAMLATMLRVDVRFTEALRTVRSNLPHRLFAAELEKLERALEAGGAIAESLRESRLIPPLVVHLLAVGQESGELPTMLEQIREHYDREVQLSMVRFLAVLEPALILVMAVLIGFVVFATLLPILETTKIVQ